MNIILNIFAFMNFIYVGGWTSSKVRRLIYFQQKHATWKRYIFELNWYRPPSEWHTKFTA